MPGREHQHTPGTTSQHQGAQMEAPHEPRPNSLLQKIQQGALPEEMHSSSVHPRAPSSSGFLPEGTNSVWQHSLQLLANIWRPLPPCSDTAQLAGRALLCRGQLHDARLPAEVGTAPCRQSPQSSPPTGGVDTELCLLQSQFCVTRGSSRSPRQSLGSHLMLAHARGADLALGGHCGHTGPAPPPMSPEGAAPDAWHAASQRDRTAAQPH